MAGRLRLRTILLRTLAFVVVIAVFAAVAIGVRAMNGGSEGDQAGGGGGWGGRAVPARAAVVELRNLEETIRGIGTLEASRVVHVSPEIDGMLTAVQFREGAVVEEGELLIEIDDRKLLRRLQSRQSALRSARARLDIAQTTFDRVQAMREQNVATIDEFDRARTDLEAARSDVEQFEAEVALIEEELKDARILAPFTGIISQRYVDSGNYVQVGERLATLYQINPLEMSFRLPERHLGRVQIGQRVEVLVGSYPDERFAGELTFISPAVDESTRDFLVKADIANDERRLRPGSFGTVLVIVGERKDRPVIPDRALIPTRTGYSVFVIEDNRAKLVPVRIGLRINGMVEITEGLEAGQVVAETGQLRLNDGGAVEIVEERRSE